MRRYGVVHVIAKTFWDRHALFGVKPTSGGSDDLP
jgi:hypothetical protein